MTFSVFCFFLFSPGVVLVANFLPSFFFFVVVVSIVVVFLFVVVVDVIVPFFICCCCFFFSTTRATWKVENGEKKTSSLPLCLSFPRCFAHFFFFA